MTGEKSRFGPGLIRIHLVPALEQQLKQLYRTCNSSSWSLVDFDSLIMDLTLLKKKWQQFWLVVFVIGVLCVQYLTYYTPAGLTTLVDLSLRASSKRPISYKL